MPTATYTIAEIASLFGIGKSAAYAAAQKDELPVPVIRIGGRYVVPKAPVDAILGISDHPQEVA